MGDDGRLMRFFVLITLMVAMAVSPAAALSSCASMTGEDHVMRGAVAPGHDMGAMAGEDCDDMSDETSRSYDAGCLAACALVCPGFYAGPDRLAESFRIFASANYAIPETGPGAATPSHLDPPPPRI